VLSNNKKDSGVRTMLRSSLRAPLSCLGLCALTAGAYAQEPASPYGIADMYLDSVRGSRLGFTGRERLGGGLNADFTLETALSVDADKYRNDALYGRQALVGFGFEPVGRVTLGRQYTGFWQITDEYSVFSNSAGGASSAVVGGFGGYEPIRGSSDAGTGSGGPLRLNNLAGYESPVWQGLRFGVQGGTGDVVNNTGGNQVTETYARFAQGPVNLAVAMLDDRGGVMTPDANRRSWIVGAAYSFGSVSVRGAYLQVDDRSGFNRDGSGWWVGADYRLGVNLVKIQYVVNRPHYIDNARTQGVGLGYEYSMSRRTTLYTGLSYFKNQDGAGLGRASFSVPGGIVNGSDNDLTQWFGGLRFSF
jgi:predicted porin